MSSSGGVQEFEMSVLSNSTSSINSTQSGGSGGTNGNRSAGSSLPSSYDSALNGSNGGLQTCRLGSAPIHNADNSSFSQALLDESEILSPGSFPAALRAKSPLLDSNSNGSIRAASASPLPSSSSLSSSSHPTTSSSSALPSTVYVPSNFRYMAIGFFQIFLIWLLYTFTAYQIGVPWQLFLKIRNVNQNSTDKGESNFQAFLLFLWIMPAYAILFPMSMGITIIVKWLLIGRYKEGKYKLWGWYYLRWWFVQRLIHLVPLNYIRGTVIMNLYARMMGMKLGSNVFLNTNNFEAWDLITIDDDASIGCDSHIANFSVEHGYLTISRIHIGARAYIGTRCIVQGNMEQDTQLGAMSLLSHGKVMKRNEAWRGSPAKKVGMVNNVYWKRHLQEQKENRERRMRMAHPSDIDEDVENGGGDYHSAPDAASSSNSQNLLTAQQSKENSSSLNSPEMSPPMSPRANEPDQISSASFTSASSTTEASYGRPSRLRLFLLGSFQFFFICGILSSIILVAAAPGLVCIHYIMKLPNSDLFPSIDTMKTVWMYFAVIPCMAVSFVIVFLLQVTIYKYLIMRKAEPGTYWIYSTWYLRKWCVDVLLQLAISTVYTMYATMYLPPWLRTLGAELGAGTEISTASDFTPDCLDIGAGCFVADSVSLGIPPIYMNRVQMSRLQVGNKTFLGNGACCNMDTKIGSDSLLGVMSCPPQPKLSKDQSRQPMTWPEVHNSIPDGTSWLGAPPMLLPNRQQAQGTFDTSSTFNPAWHMYARRLMYEFFRIILPFMFLSGCMLFYLGNFEYLLFEYNETYASLTMFWMVIWPACYLGAAFVCCFVVWLFKWVLIGIYVPGEHPLWSSFVWRSELCVGIMEALANPFFIDHLRGTPYVCMWFRMLGCEIGDRVWMDTTQITEPDLIHVGDDAVLQQDCTLQTHLFEDRIFKCSTLYLDSFCSVGTMSVLLYDSHMEDGAHIGDLSLLMKGENLNAWTRSEGVPCAPIRKNQ